MCRLAVCSIVGRSVGNGRGNSRVFVRLTAIVALRPPLVFALNGARWLQYPLFVCCCRDFGTSFVHP